MKNLELCGFRGRDVSDKIVVAELGVYGFILLSLQKFLKCSIKKTILNYLYTN